MIQTIEIIGKIILIALAMLYIYYGVSAIREDIRAHREHKRLIQAIKEFTKHLNNYNL